MRCVLAILIAVQFVMIGASPAPAKPSPYIDLVSPEAVLRWINGYRAHPDPQGVPAVVKALSRLGAFKDPENSGAYVGFIAGVLGKNPAEAEALVGKMLPLPEADQWAIVRAVAYSGLPDLRDMLRRLAPRMPSRQVMIDKYVAGKLPIIFQVYEEKKPTYWERVRGYTIDKITGYQPPKEVTLDPTPEVLDTYWGVYFATAAFRPVSRIIAMADWSKDDNSVEKLTLGNMAKYTLASNAMRDQKLIAMLKQARGYESKAASKKILDEVIEAAETAEVARLRKEALASIQDLQRKGPGYQRNVSMWGQIGQGALALSCIAAAATGQVELGLPCVVAGGLSNAALSYWNTAK
jgi:hypothetical protein